MRYQTFFSDNRKLKDKREIFISLIHDYTTRWITFKNFQIHKITTSSRQDYYLNDILICEKLTFPRHFTRILRQGNVFSSSGHLQIEKKRNELDLSLSVLWTQNQAKSVNRGTYWKYSSVFQNKLLIVIQHSEYKSFENSRIKQSSRESIGTTRLIAFDIRNEA